jgi:circadian clock protein KaiC
MDSNVAIARSSSELGLASSGIAELDSIIGGGLPRKHLYLIQGQPGVGKTTLALQFLLSGRDHGEKGLYVTLSESSQDLRLSSAAHGWNLDNIDIYEHWSTSASTSDAYHTLFHPDEVDLSETIRDLLDVVERTSPDRIVFDSLSELRLLASDDLRYRRQIIALRDKFAEQNATVLLLDDKSVTDNDLQIQSVAHGVIQLHDTAPTYGADRRWLRVIKLRGVNFRTGFHDYKIETGGLRIYPRLVAADHRTAFTPGTVTSGLPELDAMFGGGLDNGTTTLLMGPSGTGKSTVALQYATAHAARNEKVAMYAFDERLPTLFQRASTLGISLESHVASGAISVTPIDPAELTPGEFAHIVKRAVEVEGVTMVIIDSLSGYIHAMPDAKFLILQLHELLTYLGQKGVTTVIAFTQHGLLSTDPATEIDVSYLSDNILLFRYFEQSGEVRVALSIFKRRSGSHERTIREIRMNSSQGISIGEPLQRFQGVLSGSPVYSRAPDQNAPYNK